MSFRSEEPPGDEESRRPADGDAASGAVHQDTSGHAHVADSGAVRPDARAAAAETEAAQADAAAPQPRAAEAEAAEAEAADPAKAEPTQANAAAAGDAPAVDPNTGLPGKSLVLTDPDTMRALAHRARIALWQHLLFEGPATATECAPSAGLSPSACSYHLRQLARFGFVEQDHEAAANGRERPWRAVVTSTTVGELRDPVARMAAQLLDVTLHQLWNEARQRYQAREQEYPAAWQRAAGGDQTVLYLTEAELANLRERIRDLYRPLIRLSGQDRPAAAQPVQGIIDFVPLFAPPDPEAAAGDQS